MRKKIILGIVVLAAIVGIVYFNKNFTLINTIYGGKHFERTDVTKIIHKYRDSEQKDIVHYTPSLKKFTKLESLCIALSENTDYKYLSKMNDLQELTLFYSPFDGADEIVPHFNLKTLPELPNLKNLCLEGGWTEKVNFMLSDENKYNFSSIENLEIWYFEDIDFNSLKHFENLKRLYLRVTCPFSDMEYFPELQYLENAEIHFYLEETDLFDLSGLKNNKNLKSLTLRNYYEEEFILKNSDCFSELASVEELEIKNISFENIDGLLKMKSLKNLNIDDDCLTEEQIEELQSRGINVELVQRRSD